LNKQATFRNTVRMVQLEKIHRDTARSGQWFDVAFAISEMIGPLIASRVKKRHDLAGERIDGGDIAALEPIAQRAGQSEIPLPSGASVFFGDQMVYFVRGQGNGLGNQAILTPMGSALCDQTPQFR